MKYLVITLLMFPLVIFFQNCGPHGFESSDTSEFARSKASAEFTPNNSSEGDAPPSLGTIGGNPSGKLLLSPFKLMDPDEYYSLCISQILFDGHGRTEDINVSVSPGERHLSPDGTLVSNIVLTPGRYIGYTIKLDGEHCASGVSSSAKNQFGEFKTTERIQIKLFQILEIEESMDVVIDIDPIIRVMSQADSDFELFKGLWHVDTKGTIMLNKKKTE